MTKITDVVVRSNVFAKTNKTIDTVVRNTSCSSGWLRVVVQTIFGIITVASFILIVLMAVSKTPPKSISCSISNCRVKCGPATFHEDFERNVVSTVLEAGSICDNVFLTLSNIQFPNETMPLNLFSRMSSNVERLSIEDGNLRHIPPNAFLGQFSGSLRSLSLDKITISSWSSDTFVGLRSLEHLIIKDSKVLNTEGYVLRAIDETVQSVTITWIGQFNPGLITGWHDLHSLRHVDFSHNDFGDSITASTFRGISSCKVLYLNSCKITSIGAGAFDSLTDIQMLFLNDNYLTSISPGLFATILRIEDPKPRIHLQDNPWQCDCSQRDLLLLSQYDLLLVEPVCHGPEHLEGKPFSSLQKYCTDDDDVEIILNTDDRQGAQPLDTFNSRCIYGTQSRPNMSLRILSPVSRYRCGLESVGRFESKTYGNFEETDVDTINVDNAWMRPLFIMKSSQQSILEIDSSYEDGYGLVWLKSTCPNELHCMTVMPRVLRVYSILFETTYTFCPMKLSNSVIDIQRCISYNSSFFKNYHGIVQTSLQPTPLFYVATGILCLFFGAMCVYGVIRKNPTLLKGSKRILFVKHRNVDALVLPPKIPLRTSIVHDEEINIKKQGIYTVLHRDQLYPNHFHRSNSVRSDKSSTPTYVSAMQPTELQLAEWRIRNHFDKNDSIISISSDISRVYWVCDGYEDGNSKTPYESLK